MTVHARVYRRVLRRETHASRTGPAVLVAVVLALLLIAAIVGGIWALVDPAFRETSAGAVAAAVSPLARARTVTAAGIGSVALAVAALMVAALMIAAAILPGRRNRRNRITERLGVIVDDGVLADAAADRVAAHCGVDRSRVSVTLKRRSAAVRVVPTSGVPIDRETVREEAATALAEAGFASGVRASIAQRGVLS